MKKLAKGKIARIDEISAKILQADLFVLLNHLLWLYNTSLFLDYYLKYF